MFHLVNRLLDGGEPYVTIDMVHKHFPDLAYTTVRTALDRLKDQRLLAYGARVGKPLRLTFVNGDLPIAEVRRMMLARFMNKAYGNDLALLASDLEAIEGKPEYLDDQEAAYRHRGAKLKADRRASRLRNEAARRAGIEARAKAEAAKLLPDPEVLRRQYRADRNLHVLIG
jgi:hypothetical protein